MGQSSDALKVRMFARARSESEVARPARTAPFRLLLLGDFSGRTSRAESAPLRGRKPLRVDRDELDAVFARLAPELTVTPRAGGSSVTLAPRSLDDLHPDRLCRAPDIR